MKKTLLALAAVPAVMLASDAAAAQPGYGSRGNVEIGGQLDNLDARLDAAVQAGVIDRGEQRRLRYQMRDLRQLEARYAANGIDRQERAILRQRLAALRQEVRRAAGSGWSNRYGWEDNDWDRGPGSGYGGYDGPRPGQIGRNLRVGDPVSSALRGSMTDGARWGHRDRRGIYFLSDGRRVYEVNARTNRVTRIHPIR